MVWCSDAQRVVWCTNAQRMINSVNSVDDLCCWHTRLANLSIQNHFANKDWKIFLTPRESNVVDDKLSKESIQYGSIFFFDVSAKVFFHPFCFLNFVG